MREICINRDIFNFIIIFSILALVTFGLVFILVGTLIEFQTNEYREYDDKLNRWCYTSIINHEEECKVNNTVENRFLFSVLFLTIETIIIGLWFYTRQNSFKFKFCSSEQMKDRKK
jgi:hypothetical protein